MKRIAIFLVLAAQCALAQTYGRMDFSLQNAQGQAVAGAMVQVYAQSACGAAAGALATLYPAATGGTPLTQPLVTNGFGASFAYAAQGCYTVVYQSPSTGSQTFKDQNAIAASAVGGFGMVSSSGLTPGVYPVATGAQAIGDGAIDYGYTSANTLVVKTPAGATGGIRIDSATDSYGLADGPINVISGQGISLSTDITSDPTGLGINISNSNGTAGTKIMDGSAAGVQILASGSGNATVESSGSGSATLASDNGAANIIGLGINMTGTGGGVIEISQAASGKIDIDGAGGDISLKSGPVIMNGITGHGSKGPVCIDTSGVLYVGNNSGVGAPCP